MMMQYQNKEFVLLPNARRTYVDCETRRVVIKVFESAEAAEGVRQREELLYELIPEFLAHHPLTTDGPVLRMRYVDHLEPISSSSSMTWLLQSMAAIVGALPRFGVSCMEGRPVGGTWLQNTETKRLVILKPLEFFKKKLLGPIENQLIMVPRILEYLDRVIMRSSAPSKIYNLLLHTHVATKKLRLAAQIQLLKQLALHIMADDASGGEWLEKTELALDDLFATKLCFL